MVLTKCKLVEEQDKLIGPKKKFLITGAKSQLGQEFERKLSNADLECVFLSREQLDITNLQAIDQVVREFQPTHIINTAAWTSVDGAEINQELCFKTNALGPELLALSAKKYGAFLIHYSTDYVFSGLKNSPYVEEDVPDPKSTYGKSKYAGELAVLSVHREMSFLIRTSWLFGNYGENFYKTVAKMANSGDNAKIVSDQLGKPTWTQHLCELTIALVNSSLAPGTYHIANSTITNWYDFAVRIYQELGKQPNLVIPITSAEYHSETFRPAYSELSTEKIEKGLSCLIPTWYDALHEAVLKSNKW